MNEFVLILLGSFLLYFHSCIQFVKFIHFSSIAGVNSRYLQQMVQCAYIWYVYMCACDSIKIVTASAVLSDILMPVNINNEELFSALIHQWELNSMKFAFVYWDFCHLIDWGCPSEIGVKSTTEQKCISTRRSSTRIHANGSWTDRLALFAAFLQMSCVKIIRLHQLQITFRQSHTNSREKRTKNFQFLNQSKNQDVKVRRIGWANQK